MTYHIEIYADVDVQANVNEILITAASTALSQQSYPPVSMTLLLVDDSRIQQLNRDFRGIDRPTDVLSFPAGELSPNSLEELPYVGDIAISMPYARKQAEAGEHSLLAELQLLVVHGTLHLIGYDHITKEDKARMWSLQQEILTQLGLHYIAPTED
ncbi:MAG: rRNA maturation RNase YbeY [Chloroflexi bacterium]|jgi:probable rRNA maturation factor|nr:rRNA maturation RNase YbeY [Chloroflexota bacterium]